MRILAYIRNIIQQGRFSLTLLLCDQGQLDLISSVIRVGCQSVTAPLIRVFNVLQYHVQKSSFSHRLYFKFIIAASERCTDRHVIEHLSCFRYLVKSSHIIARAATESLNMF